MPSSGSIFECLPNLDSLTAEEIDSRGGRPEHLKLLENELGNLILYPEVVPITAQDVEFELSILRGLLRKYPQDYYNANFRKLIIPEALSIRFQDLQQLIRVFIDALNPIGLTAVFLKSHDMGAKNFGLIMRPEIKNNNGKITVWVNGKKYEAKVGSSTMIPADNKKVDIKFESDDALLEGRNSVATEVAGGQLGLVVDARKK